MAKKQRVDLFLENGIAKSPSRPVLNLIYKDEDATVSASGFRLHVDYGENDYEIGLNHTKYSEKKGQELEGRYPDYTAITAQKDHSGFFVFTLDDLTEIKQAVKTAMVFAKDMADSVRFEMLWEEKSFWLEVRGYSPQRGEAWTRVEIDCEHKTWSMTSKPKFHLNGRYVLKALDGLKNDGTVTFKFSTTEPNFFESDTRLVAIMPMRA